MCFVWSEKFFSLITKNTEPAVPVVCFLFADRVLDAKQDDKS